MKQPKYEIIPATVEHTVALAPVLRKADADEVYAASGMDNESVLAAAVRLSPKAWAGVDKDGVFAMWGVGEASALSGRGVPWLLGADRLVTTHRRALMADARAVVRRMRRCYHVLENYVDARNEASIRWLKRCGFVLYPPMSYGFAGLPFHRFRMWGDL